MIYAEASRAQMQPSKEQRQLLGIERENERPADVLIPNYHYGHTLCVDVTIVSSFVDIHEAAKMPGYNAERAAANKVSKYGAAVEAQNMQFLPFAMESLGGLSASCTKVLEFIASSLYRIDRTSKPRAKNRLHDKLVFNWMLDLGTTLAEHARECATLYYSSQ